VKENKAGHIAHPLKRERSRTPGGAARGKEIYRTEGDSGAGMGRIRSRYYLRPEGTPLAGARR